MPDASVPRARAELNQAREILRRSILPEAWEAPGTEKFFHRPGATCAAKRGQAAETSDSPYRRRLADAARVPICGKMHASNQGSGGTLDARFLRTVEAWRARNGTTSGAFGTAACRDRGFVTSLREGRRPRLRTVDRALAVMGEAPVTPAFLKEVKAFLAVTGTKRSALGLKATGNPSFVAKLLAGVSPSLATVEAVRAWMAANSDAAERRAIRARTGAMPSFLAGDPPPSLAPRARPEDRDFGTERPGQRPDDGRYLDTREAARRLGLAPATLARYRITGEGPCHFRFGGCVRYRRDDLEAWDADRRRSRKGDAALQALP